MTATAKNTPIKRVANVNEPMQGLLYLIRRKEPSRLLKFAFLEVYRTFKACWTRAVVYSSIAVLLPVSD